MWGVGGRLCVCVGIRCEVKGPPWEFDIACLLLVLYVHVNIRFIHFVRSKRFQCMTCRPFMKFGN